MSLKISNVIYESLVDAEGVSTVMFFSGCKHYCSGCHSQVTWDFNYGIEVNDELINQINLEIDKRPYLNALVLSGGDPMYSAKEIINFLPKIHIPNNNIWCYSGFTLEQILNDPIKKELLFKCNVLIDGLFVKELRDITLNYRGSSNQNIYRKINNMWINDNNSIT